MRRAILAFFLIGAAALTGCAQAGLFAAGNMTTVELAEPNFEVVATSVGGSSSAAYLIGVSYSMGHRTESVSLFRVRGTGELYGEAMANLWSQFAEEHGPVEGRKLALVNVRYDSSVRNYLLYNEAKLTIRADIVEFAD